MNALLKKFIKDYENVNNPKVRQRYGTFSSVVGIIANIFLFIIKYIIGTFSNSISIISDGFNNLSDCASSVITLIGYKMSAKPADKDHPFGHGRLEYLVSLVIAVVILLVGVELLKVSGNKILHPQQVIFTWVALLTLILSILIKLWLSFFNRNLGKRINSGIMLAVAKDSLNDVIATAVTVISLVGSLFTNLPLDGIMGVVVSIFILYSGFGIIRDTVDQLLGQPADPETVTRIEELVQSREEILGMHDLIIHNYGPGKQIGSAHVEVCSEGDFIKIHDVVDELEKKIQNEMHIMMTLHMDPIETENEMVMEYQMEMSNIVSDIFDGLSIHDFRVVTGPSHTNFIFDILVPYHCPYKNKEIKKRVDEALAQKDGVWYAVITFDRSYC